MGRNYVGRLSENDPLHAYLQQDIQPQISGAKGCSTYRVFRLNGSNDVYLYEDRNTGTKVIGKFFLSSRKKDTVKAVSRLTRESDNLCMMRDYGLTGYPHHVVRPLGRNYSMNALLVTEYCEGQLLSDVILEVIQSGDHGKLYHNVWGAQRSGLKTVFFKSNQGTQEKEGVKPDYIIYSFPELLNAIRFFEEH